MRMICFGHIFFSLLIGFYVTSDAAVAKNTVLEKIKTRPEKTKEQLKLEEAKDAEKTRARQKATIRSKAKQPLKIEQVNLPEDTSSRFTIKNLRLSGNTLITTDELLANIPLVYNSSGKPANEAEPADLYDLRILHDVILDPNQPHDVSRRTMQGLTQYILSAYQDKGYAGIYVYISAKAVDGSAQFQDGILPIDVVEAKVSEITVIPYDAAGQKVEKGILRNSAITAWSPVKIGEVVKKKELGDFANLLNLNPDRYVSPVISRGSEPDTLALDYNIYEANPWHYYIQLDNSGTKGRQLAPRIGFINTNFTGRDDLFTATYQGKPESGQDNFGAFGSYDFPLFTPRLRLNLYGGHSEFDVGGDEDIDFLGNGSFYGGILRYNLFQKNGWFFDVTSSLSHEHSEVTPSLFPAPGSDVDMNLLGTGVSIHRSGDIADTYFSFEQVRNIGGSGQNSFWNSTTLTGARANSDKDFSIYNFLAAHSQYLNPNKIQRLSVSFRQIIPDERLAPSKMTSFGGLYSVRGYEENEIVADGGTLLSAQYEFDLVKRNQFIENNGSQMEQESENPWLKKFAILAFTDYARARIKDSVPGERGTQELSSIGLGLAVATRNNIDAVVYYGYPLKSTDDTTRGRGRWNFSLTMRW